MDNQVLQKVLGALGDQVALRTDQPLAIVVCGGSALQALGLVERTTRDVDVLAIIHTTDSSNSLALITAEPLPQVLLDAAHAVARDFGLPSNWLNSGPTDLLTEGLPQGCVERLHSFSYGNHLTVYFIDRFDQICLKTYAAINGDAQRHLADLQSLTPTDEEMLAAARWTLTQDASDFYPDYVRSFLEQTGFPHVAEQL